MQGVTADLGQQLHANGERIRKAQEEIQAAFAEKRKLRAQLLMELDESLYPLTRREAEVADLIRERKTNKEIASELNISLSGVRFHVTSILRKYGVTSRNLLFR